jgi:hypothetical protein
LSAGFAALLLAILSVPEGAQTEAPPPSVPAVAGETRAALVRKRAAHDPHVQGKLTLGADLATYRAALEAGKAVYVEERVAVPQRAARVNRYYFAQGVPFFYRGEVPAGVALPGGPTASAPTLAVVVEWNEAGQPVRALRMEHYGPVKLDDATVAAIRSRARLLAGLAATQWLAHGNAAQPPADH